MKEHTYFVSWVDSADDGLGLCVGNHTITCNRVGRELVNHVIKIITKDRPRATVIGINRVD